MINFYYSNYCENDPVYVTLYCESDPKLDPRLDNLRAIKNINCRTIDLGRLKSDRRRNNWVVG